MAQTFQPTTPKQKSLHFFLSALVLLFKGQLAYGLALEIKKPKKSLIVKEKVYFGKTKTGKKLYVIRAYKKEHKLPMRPAVLVTGGIHGNEHMGLVAGLADLASEEDKGFKEFFEAGGIAYFIPEVNPDGVERGHRYNPQGVDLNRDFKIDRRPGQSESSQMLGFLEADLDAFHARLILAMDYHCCSKSLIYPELKKDSGFYKRQFEKIVKLMQTHVDPEYTSGLTKDIFGYETHGTLKGYWFKKHGALSFTYEGADPKKERKKLAGHHNWWKELLGIVVDVYDNNLAQLAPSSFPAKNSVEDPAVYTE